jgi:serine/threonine-protein kinase
MNVCPECGASTDLGQCRADGCPTIAEADLTSPEHGEVGQLVAEKYRLLNIIGRGGMGVVYRAWHRDMRRTVALKVTNAQSSDDAGTRRFLREVQIVAGLSHSNTVRVFDYGQLPDGRLYFTMEFLEGQPLSRLLRNKELFDDLRILRVGSQILKSLGEAHAAGIVHRDLSPDNIFLCQMYGETDHVKVLDFGAAKGMAFEFGDEKLTQAGMFVGKPRYASPEQVEDTLELDGRADLYSLGIVLYQMIAGQVPFQCTTPMKTLIAHVRETPRPVTEVASRPVNPDLARLVMRLLSKNRDDRPQDASVALEELLRIEDACVRRAASDDVGLRTVAIRRGASIGAFRRRWLIVAVVALAAGCIGAVGLTWWGEGHDEGITTTAPASTTSEPSPGTPQPAQASTPLPTATPIPSTEAAPPVVATPIPVLHNGSQVAPAQAKGANPKQAASKARPIIDRQTNAPPHAPQKARAPRPAPKNAPWSF